MFTLRPVLRPSIQHNASRIASCSTKVCTPADIAKVRHTDRGTWRCDGNNIGGGLMLRKQSKERSFEDIFVRSLVEAGSCRRCIPHGGLRSRARGTGEIRNRRHVSKCGTQSRQRSFSNAARNTQTPVFLAAEPEEPEQDISRKSYENLLNTYSSPSDLWEQPSHIQPRPPQTLSPGTAITLRQHIPLAPRLVITPEQEDKPPHRRRVVLEPEDEEHARQINSLRRALRSDLGRRQNEIWIKYLRIHGPRPRYLTDDDIHRLFRHLAWVEFKDLSSSQRYFALLDECLGERVALLASEWNTAIAFAARWIRNTSSQEVKTAIETWMRMEQSGAQATNVTFNILFDAAARAGRFALADTIYSEMRQREMPLNRNFRTSMIFYAGLRRDGEAVRQAFRELVNAGEIVDTAVMNCVILSLIRADEATAAEHVFAKMKDLHFHKFIGTAGPNDWQGRKRLGKELDRIARQLRRNKQEHEASFFGAVFASNDKKEEAQRAAPIHPDAHTCRMLIKYHAYVSGNLDRIRQLLAETKNLADSETFDGGDSGASTVHGSVYVYILRGFYQHGGHAHTSWNRNALEEFWEEFLQAASFEEFVRAQEQSKTAKASPTDLDYSSPNAHSDAEEGPYSPFHNSRTEPNDAWSTNSSEMRDPELEAAEAEDAEIPREHRPPHFTAGLAIRAMYAFYKCAGRKRMLQVWAQIQDRWKDPNAMTTGERAAVEEHVQRLVRDDSRYVD